MKETLDTSAMSIERTHDGFSRLVDHERRLLTIGFTTEEALRKFKFPSHELSMTAMRTRYDTFFGAK